MFIWYMHYCATLTPWSHAGDAPVHSAKLLGESACAGIAIAEQPGPPGARACACVCVCVYVHARIRRKVAWQLSDVAQGELERVARGEVMQTMDLTRYRLEPPAGPAETDVQAWREAVDNAHAQLGHQRCRCVRRARGLHGS